MRKTMRARLEDGETLIGPLLDMIDPTRVELVGHGGYDYAVFEYEHGLRSLETVQGLIRAAEGAGLHSLVRIGTADPNLISRLFEAGVTGVMVAHIKTREEAETIVSASKYPPEGTRGQGYVRRGRLWKLGPESNRLDREANRDSIVIALIEDPEGIENIEEILDVPGLTGVAPGPADLAASMGGLELDAPEVVTALETIRKAVTARDDRYQLELLAEPEAAPALVARGTQLLMLNHDVILVGEFYEGLLERAQRALGRTETTP
jgi:2-keto-3-deoxy-L-rhamnonate aldolase RhmA